MIGERRTTSLFHFHKLNLDGLFTGPDLFVNQVGHGQYHILSDQGIHNMVPFFRSLPPLLMFPFPVSRRIWSEWEILSPSLSPISSIWRRSDHLGALIRQHIALIETLCGSIDFADQTTHCADHEGNALQSIVSFEVITKSSGAMEENEAWPHVYIKHQT